MSKESIQNPSTPPETMPEGVTISASTNIFGWNTFTITPQDEESSPKKDILYLHGGAFVWHMLDTHWAFLSEMARKTKARITVPAYPLAVINDPAFPPGRYATAPVIVPQMADLLASSIETAQEEGASLFLMGDSAGGNIAVSSMLSNRDKDRSLPTATILISPFLELGLPDEDIHSIVAPNMSVSALREDAHSWRGSWPVEHPLISPSRARLHDLGNIALFCGTADVVYPGCQRFADSAATQKGTIVSFYQQPGEPHSNLIAGTAMGMQSRDCL